MDRRGCTKFILVLYYLHRTQCNDSCIEALNDIYYMNEQRIWKDGPDAKKRELGNTVARGVGVRVLWARLSEELQFNGERC